MGPRTFLAGKRRLVICVMVASLGLFLVSAIWILRDIAENQRIDAEAVTYKDDLTIPFGTTAKASDFVENLNGTLTDDFEIKTDELGETEASFEYINVKNKHRKAHFKVEVVDVTAPQIHGRSTYTVYENYDGDLGNLMLSGDDLDDHPKRSVEGDYDLSKAGSYAVEYVAVDESGNESRKPFTLNVVTPAQNSSTTTAPASDAEAEKTEFAEIVKQHKTDATKIGIDVSAWQGEVDWAKVKQAGAEFAIIRLGYQDGYGGKYELDRYFKRNVEGANAAGLPVGVYFYSYANSADEAKKQAKWVLEKIRGYRVELGATFDWENWTKFNEAGMSFWTLNQTARTFLDTVQKAGYRSLLYGSTNYLKLFWDVPEHETWVAQYYDHVTYEGDYTLWQICDTGRIDGINGAVDIDIMYDREE